MREDWEETTIGDVCWINMGQSPPSSTYNTEKIGLPFFQGKAEFTNLYPIVKKWCSEPKKIANAGDILLSVRAPVGATNMANKKCAIGRGLAAITYAFCTNYIWYYLKLIEKKLDNQGTGTTFRAISGTILKAQKIKLPTLPEQRAIVSKIEELFSDLDKGIADLKKAQEQLKVYRQAVLKKAFEGELTKEWREQQTDLPTADELLEQIKEERQKHYEQQLENWKQAVKAWEENGKEGKKPKKPRALDTSVINDWNVKFATPSQWKLCQMGDIISNLTDYHANGSYVVLKENVKLSDSPNYAVMIRATNFEKNDFTNDLKYVDEHGYNFLSKSKLFGGEILIGKIGNAGRVYHMPHLNRKASLAMNLFALRFDSVQSNFIYYQLKNFYQEREIKNYVRGVGNPTIDKISIRSIHINLCSSKEQHQIVQEIESRLSVCDKVEESITQSLERAKALRQSILKKAFEGSLLSEAEVSACKQAKDYEPASVLLERIKSEKPSAIASASKGKKK